MRILLINESDEPIGGAAIIFKTQAKLLENSGHDVYTFSFGRVFQQNERNLRLPINKNFLVAKLIKYTLHPKVYWRLRSFINKIHPELVIIHNNALCPITILIACRGYPTLHVAHDFYLVCPLYGAVQRRTLQTCRRGIGIGCIKECGINPFVLLFFYWPFFYLRRTILRRIVRVFIAPSKILSEYLTRFGYKARLLRNPVPLALENYGDLSNFIYYMLPSININGEFYLLYVGVLSIHKGIDCLINAFDIIRKEKPNIKLKLVGEGPYRATLEIQAKKLGVIDSIEFLGFVPHSHLYNLYKGAVALVIPSYRCQENFPTVVIEAMAYGCPVIGSALGGIPELLGQNDRGLLFRPGDAKDLSDKILMLLDFPVLRYKLIKRAKLYVERELHSENYLHGLMEIAKGAIK